MKQSSSECEKSLYMNSLVVSNINYFVYTWSPVDTSTHTVLYIANIESLTVFIGPCTLQYVVMWHSMTKDVRADLAITRGHTY